MLFVFQKTQASQFNSLRASIIESIIFHVSFLYLSNKINDMKKRNKTIYYYTQIMKRIHLKLKNKNKHTPKKT